MNKINNSELRDLFIKLGNNESLDAFETLYNKYSNLVYRVAFSILKNKEDSEDIVQAVFTKISTMCREDFPFQNVSSWLYSATKNEAISLLRKKKSAIDLDSIYDIEDTDDEVNSAIDRLEFNNLINRLNPKEREIVSLKILNNFSFDEISGLLDEPTGTVKWRYYKSIYSLRLLLGNLSMFIISFIVGLKTLIIKNVKEQSESEIKEENSTQNRVYEDIAQSENKTKDGLENNLNSYINSESAREEVQVPSNIETTSINFYSVGLLTISGIFLFFTIFFSIIFIKYQLKGVFKSSK